LGITPRELKMKKTIEVYNSVEILSNKKRANVGFFDKAENRFSLPKDKVRNPSPHKYDPTKCL